MTNIVKARMLLSHNFDLSEDILPALSREEFSQVFIDGLQDIADCRLVSNPHWIVEVLFDTDKYFPAQMGEYYANALAKLRQEQIQNDDHLPDILILGGIKTTPAMSTSPDSLHPGEWGVDVVETSNGGNFLAAIGWGNAIANKPPESIFKVEWKESR
ncbi:DUF2656 domain-containing protein [Calothrix rhizosoleniae]|uniref:DUF2656 domain-containing protein n=1 Tax=Calothrix rhizosoleniae TaxID=888997 RepID=UPI001F37EF7A|nr:DUF2656 domain-containing protein [Calothrix rhizosoleniae]